MTEAGPEFDSERLTDFLKMAAATVNQAGDKLYEIRPTSTAQETAGAVESFIIYLSAAYRLLQNLVGTICPHCSNRMGHYADKRDGAIVPRRGRSDGFSYKTVTSASKNR